MVKEMEVMTPVEPPRRKIGCGIKVKPHSPEQVVGEMATALGRLYSDKEFRLRMGKAARERAEREYHWDRLGERLQKIYEGALGLQTGWR